MTETAVKIVANCFIAGKIPSRLGRYSLSTPKRVTVPLKYAMVRRTDNPGLASPRGVENAPLPSPDLLQRWAAEGGDSPVLVLTTQLPKLVLAPFIMAGEKYLEDLKSHCKWVIFSPHISTGGKWQDGFVVQGDEAALDRLEEKIFRENFSQLPLDKTMFLNLQDAGGNCIAGQDFGWTMARLLGEMMVNPLLIARGLNVTTLGEDARKVFAARYQMGFVRNLADQLERDYGDEFRQGPDKIFFDNKLRFLQVQARFPLPAPEAEIIEQLLAA